MPRPTHIQLLYAVIGIGAIVTVGLAFYAERLELKDLIAAALSLIGTFLGASFAFRLTQDSERRKQQTQQKEALNRALFVLARQMNAIYNLKKDYDSIPDPVERAFNLPALKPPNYAEVRQRITDLEFLLSAKDPNLLFRPAIEDERFHQAILAIEMRNSFYVDEFQPTMSEARLNGKRISAAQAEQVLGERILGGLLNGTRIAYEHLSASETSLPEMLEALTLAAKQAFPGEKFITFNRAAYPLAQADLLRQA